jgi:hypothetical protein
MPQTKREKKAAKYEGDRLRRQACWLEHKHSGRKLREAQNADDVHETDQTLGTCVHMRRRRSYTFGRVGVWAGRSFLAMLSG